MNTLTSQTIFKEVINVITSIKKVTAQQLIKVNDLTELGFDILDVVEIILKLEKKFDLVIPDDVPVYSVDDFVDFIYTYKLYNKAG